MHFPIKTYQVGCRICGAEWTEESEFISATAFVTGRDGTSRLDLPGHCPIGHTPEEIRASFGRRETAIDEAFPDADS